MKIGELALAAGVRPSRIRYYEEIGLLQSVRRKPNGYRVYGQQSVTALKMILMAQKAGFSLDEIRMLMPKQLPGLDHRLLAEMLDRKMAEIEAEEARLAVGKARLMAIRDGVAGRPDGIDCTEIARRVIELVSTISGSDAAGAPKRTDDGEC